MVAISIYVTGSNLRAQGLLPQEVPGSLRLTKDILVQMLTFLHGGLGLTKNVSSGIHIHIPVQSSMMRHPSDHLSEEKENWLPENISGATYHGDGIMYVSAPVDSSVAALAAFRISEVLLSLSSPAS